MRNNSRSWGCNARVVSRWGIVERARNSKRGTLLCLWSPAIVRGGLVSYPFSASCAVSDKSWGGRFTSPTDDRVEAFTESISFDRRLYRHDIVASKAHARMLAEVGLLTADEAERIVHALAEICAEIERGQFAFSIQREDIHTHIEQALIQRLGDVGRKLH